jgi:hypothetical protein
MAISSPAGISAMNLQQRFIFIVGVFERNRKINQAWLPLSILAKWCAEKGDQ